MTDTNKVEDTARLNFVEANPTKSLRYHKKRWAFVGLTSYEYETYRTPREAIDAVMGEVGINGLTEAETLQTASVMGLTKVDVEQGWTLLLTGDNVHGLVAERGYKFVGSPEHYQRVDAVPASALAAEQAKVWELVEALESVAAMSEEAGISRFARSAIAKYGEQK